MKDGPLRGSPAVGFRKLSAQVRGLGPRRGRVFLELFAPRGLVASALRRRGLAAFVWPTAGGPDTQADSEENSQLLRGWVASGLVAGVFVGRVAPLTLDKLLGLLAVCLRFDVPFVVDLGFNAARGDLKQLTGHAAVRRVRPHLCRYGARWRLPRPLLVGGAPADKLSTRCSGKKCCEEGCCHTAPPSGAGLPTPLVAKIADALLNGAARARMRDVKSLWCDGEDREVTVFRVDSTRFLAGSLAAHPPRNAQSSAGPVEGKPHYTALYQATDTLAMNIAE